MYSDPSDLKGPAVRFPPPLLFVAVIVGSLALDRLLPLPVLTGTATKLAGASLVIAGMAIIGAAAALFRRARTHIEPWKPTSSIIQHGIFARSRNPVYLAFCLLQAGVGLWLGSLWTLATTPVSAALVFLIAIRNEERYLERKFGDEYLRYKERVRRWI